MAGQGFRAQLASMFGRAAAAGARAAVRELQRRTKTSGTGTTSRTSPAGPRQSGAGRSEAGRSGTTRSGAAGSRQQAYAGDFTGSVHPEYDPRDDGHPDPGEVVWAWVPYEEDHTQGKDRPVLVIATYRGDLLGLMLTSKDHDRDQAQEARSGRHWLDVGPGAWDRQGRPSEVRLDRVLRLDPTAVRREGATLDRETYAKVAAGVRRYRP